MHKHESIKPTGRRYRNVRELIKGEDLGEKVAKEFEAIRASTRASQQLSKGMKIRFSADQKAAISILAKRAYLNDSTFVRQLVHYYLLANHPIYAKRCIPNAETQAAIDAAERGELSSFTSVEELMADLNAPD